MVKGIRLTGVMLIISCGQSFAARTPPPSGSLFSVAATGNVLSVKTTIPTHIYPNAGIYVKTPGFALQNAGSECIPAENGYCLFTTSDTLPKTITITGPVGAYTFSLCLNGVESRYSCQDYTQTIPGVTIGGTIAAIKLFDPYTLTTFFFQNNLKDVLELEPAVDATPAPFTFRQSIPYGGNYSVTLLSQNPPLDATAVKCVINNPTGTNVISNVTNLRTGQKSYSDPIRCINV